MRWNDAFTVANRCFAAFSPVKCVSLMRLSSDEKGIDNTNTPNSTTRENTSCPRCGSSFYLLAATLFANQVIS